MASQKNESLAVEVAAFVSGHYTFFRSHEGKACGFTNQESHIAMPLRGAGSIAQAVQAAFLADHSRPVPTNVLNEVMAAYEGVALTSDPRDVNIRYANDPDGNVVVDLGTKDGPQSVVITPEGWKKKDQPPAGVMFRRPSSSLVMDVQECSIEEGWKLVGDLFMLPEDEFHLIFSWLVAAIIPGIPHPVLHLLGGQGSGKTVRSRAIKTLLHPSTVLAQAEPRSVRDWVSIGSASPVVVLDNVSVIQPWFSDALCRAVTGDALQSRALYSDSDATVAIFQSTIVLNSIEIEGVRGDLADRSFTVRCPRIERSSRRTDRDMQDLLITSAPKIRGALFTAVSEVLKRLPSISLEEMGRLADYEKVVAALDEAIGGTRLVDAHKGVQSEALHDILESSPTFEAFTSYMAGRQVVDIKPTELYEQMLHCYIAKNIGMQISKCFPGNGKSMCAWLRRNEESLVTHGYRIHIFKDRDKYTFINIKHEGG